MPSERRAEWTTFATPQGFCGIAWTEAGVTVFCLPEADASAVIARLRALSGRARASNKLPAWIKTLIPRVRAHLKGDVQDFSEVPLAFAGTEFVRAVYRAAQQIPAGGVRTYADIAAQIGQPAATRAVGTALGKNPVPLLVPCHRVISAGGKLGGFSGPGGVNQKIALLDAEGVCLVPPRVIASNAQWLKAIATLQKQEPLLGKLIARTPPFAFTPHLQDEPLSSLIKAVISQQLSVKAAATIHQRVIALIHEDGVPHPEKLLSTPEAELRAAGLSFMKISYLKDLAQKYLHGLLPTLDEIQTLSDEQIIKRFTAVKGIGRWTVEMYLIFNLGRIDVWPVLDLGVRKGIAKLHGLPETPSADEAQEYGDAWRPHRSVASLYLWRSLDNAP